MTRSVPAVLPGPGVGELREKHPGPRVEVGEQVVGGRRRGGVLHPEHRFLDDLLLRRPAPVDGGVATPERRAMALMVVLVKPTSPSRSRVAARIDRSSLGPVAYLRKRVPVSVRSRLMTIPENTSLSNQIRSDSICNILRSVTQITGECRCSPPQDELLTHQLPTTFDHVGQSDLRWTERIVMYGFDRSGDISIMTGMARYPNRNVMDAYAMVTSRARRREWCGCPPRSVPPRRTHLVEHRPVHLLDHRTSQDGHLDARLQRAGHQPAPGADRHLPGVRADPRLPPHPRPRAGGRPPLLPERHRHRLDRGRRRAHRDRPRPLVVRPRPLVGCGTAAVAAALRRRQSPAPEIPDGVLYYMGIFQFDEELVHFAQRETSTGQRWQFEGEVLYPLETGRDSLPIIDVEHELVPRGPPRHRRGQRLRRAPLRPQHRHHQRDADL